MTSRYETDVPLITNTSGSVLVFAGFHGNTRTAVRTADQVAGLAAEHRQHQEEKSEVKTPSSN